MSTSGNYAKRAANEHRLDAAFMMDHLRDKGLVIAGLDDAQQWASQLKASILEGREQGRLGAVQDLSYYETRMKAVRMLCDSIRNKVARAAVAAGLMQKGKHPQGRAKRLDRASYVQSIEVDDAGLIREILRILNQARTNFGAQQPWALDLVIAGMDGKGERQKRYKQLGLLAFLASYGPANPEYTAATFPLVMRQFRTGYQADRWLDLQQSQIVRVDKCPEWTQFRKLCLEHQLGDWFRELCAHQWFLYRTGYFLEQASYLSDYLRNHMIFYGPSSAASEECLGRVDAILFEFHVALSELRFVVAEPTGMSGDTGQKNVASRNKHGATRLMRNE